MDKSEVIYGIGVYGKLNSGKCTLNKELSMKYGRVDKTNWFKYNNIGYHIFPIPCIEQDYNENFEISMLNGDIAIVMIDMSVTYNKNDIDFYDNILINCFVNNTNKVILCFNKKDIKQWNENEMNQFKDDINTMIVNYKKIYTHDIDISYVEISIKDNQGIDTLLSLIDMSKFTLSKSNPVMMIFDSYSDKDENTMVITGKLLQGELSLNTKLQYKNITSNTSIVSSPIKMCNSEGGYLSSLHENSFLTVKFPLSAFSSIQAINKSSLLLNESPLDTDYAIFDTFEASIMITSSPCSIIAKGYLCLLSSYSFIAECSIENIIGKKVLTCDKYSIAKVIIKSKEVLMRNKYELSHHLGSFSLKKEGKIIAIGVINKYKKYNK